MLNKNGLSRSIPEAIKLAVRQRDGFGCVVCGMAIFHYDHLKINYAQAECHNAEDIILLCANDHDKKTRGLLSIDTLRKYAAYPAAKKHGFSWGTFDIGDKGLIVNLGSFQFIDCQTILRICDKDVLSISPPEFEGGPFLLNAFISDLAGSEVLKIVNNEWQSSSKNWDVVMKGRVITIRKNLKILF